MNYEDRVTKEYVENLLDGRIFVGSYVGDGAETRTIQLPWAPKFMVLFSCYEYYSISKLLHVITQNEGHSISSSVGSLLFVSLEGDQLNITQEGSAYNNIAGQTMYYVLFR